MSLILKTARALAEKGMHVFACMPRDKRPATPHGLKDASVDPFEIEAWWAQNPNYNLALVTGSMSGVFVVDVDGEEAAAARRAAGDRRIDHRPRQASLLQVPRHADP